MKYTYLLFDVDNTIMDFDLAEHTAMTETLQHFGYPATDEVISRYSRINDDHWKMLERGEVDRAWVMWHRFYELGEVFGFRGMDPHAFAEQYLESLSHQSFLIDGALEVCRCLAKRYAMYAITNGNAKVQVGRFAPSPLAPLFRHCFISEEMGCNKPSIEYFNKVRLAVPDLVPEETLVIGDSLTSDIAGGIRWGTDTCWYRPAKNRNINSGDLSPTYIIERLEELTDILL